MQNPSHIIKSSNSCLEKKKILFCEYLLRDKMIEIENYLKDKFIFLQEKILMN